MFSRSTCVKYSQLAPNGGLSVPALLDLFQDLATLHAQNFSSGPDELYAMGRAWILSRWRVRLFDMPRCGADIGVHTRAYSCRRALNRRDFWLTDDRGNILARADSLWTLIDTETGGPADASAITAPYLTPGEGPDLGALPRKVTLPQELTPQADFPITRDLLDTNRHVNNVRSAALALRYVPEDLSFSAIALDYHQPLLPGHRVTPLCGPTPEGYAVALTAGGQCCVSAEFIR